ncbi:hypothetical protein [Arthrobacter mobilis]|uniref:hypothetical protein n=1 Tax=Arthrobacter mobilis TaxID=2724944 RepID=UPI00197C9DD2|nr:hypothetical protein [Arthrobacter mobilis]
MNRDNFPTDRYVLEGTAAEGGLELDWLDVPCDGGAGSGLDMVALIAEAGIGASRDKPMPLTDYALDAADGLLAGAGVVAASPREAARFEEVYRGVAAIAAEVDRDGGRP